MMERKYKEEAKMFTNAIRNFAGNPSAIDNLEGYLSIHFDEWLNKWASSPEDIAGEMINFSRIA